MRCWSRALRVTARPTRASMRRVALHTAAVARASTAANAGASTGRSTASVTARRRVLSLAAASSFGLSVAAAAYSLSARASAQPASAGHDLVVPPASVGIVTSVPDDPNARTKADAVGVFAAALHAADPFVAVRNALRVTDDGRTLSVGAPGGAQTPVQLDLRAFDRVVVVGAGKAASAMARAVERVLSDAQVSVPVSGHVITKHQHARGHGLQRVGVSEGGHPVPDAAGVAATTKLLAQLHGADERTLVLCVMSGGASALLTAPADGLTLADVQQCNSALLGSGATISELNAVRKHLSRVTGGRLAAAAFPATTVCLALSDVIGDALDVIGSGPTVPDPTRWADVHDVVDRYQLRGKLTPAVLARIDAAAADDETPKPGDTRLSRAHSFVVGSNALALAAAAAEAKRRGYNALPLSSSVSGEAATVGASYASMAARVLRGDASVGVARPACIIAGGETTVALGDAPGIGGRNQELALAAAQALTDTRTELALPALSGTVVLSAGTDGTDGPTPAAGAVVDADVVLRGSARGAVARDALQRHDSYRFFERAGEGHIITGPTGTNVMDIAVVIVP